VTVHDMAVKMQQSDISLNKMEKICLNIVSLEILPVKRRLGISRGEEKARPQFIHWLKPVVFLGIFYKKIGSFWMVEVVRR